MMGGFGSESAMWLLKDHAQHLSRKGAETEAENRYIDFANEINGTQIPYNQRAPAPGQRAAIMLQVANVARYQ
jgi:hypothetical protein